MQVNEQKARLEKEKATLETEKEVLQTRVAENEAKKLEFVKKIEAFENWRTDIEETATRAFQASSGLAELVGQSEGTIDRVRAEVRAAIIHSQEEAKHDSSDSPQGFPAAERPTSYEEVPTKEHKALQQQVAQLTRSATKQIHQ